VPILQLENDCMEPKYYTQKTFREIGSVKKKLVLVQRPAHFPTDKEAYKIWVEEIDQFIRSICENK